MSITPFLILLHDAIFGKRANKKALPTSVLGDGENASYGNGAAHKGERVLIPINMRDGSVLAVGRGNPDWNYSAPHGAGRILSRSDARDYRSQSPFCIARISKLHPRVKFVNFACGCDFCFQGC